MGKRLLLVVFLILILLQSFGGNTIVNNACLAKRYDILSIPRNNIPVEDSAANRIYIIKGRVYDSVLKINLVRASVFIQNRKIGCVTDADGNFELHLPAKYSGKNFTLVGAYIGYDAIKIRVRNKKRLSNGEYIFYLRQTPAVLDKIVNICCE